MDAELKAKWVAALRSGKFEQGKNCLRSPTEEFCCLGVLGEISAPDRWEKREYTLEPGFFWEFENRESFLPEDFAAELGLTEKVQEDLSDMNDGVGDHVGAPKNFAEIADYIEKNL